MTEPFVPTGLEYDEGALDEMARVEPSTSQAHDPKGASASETVHSFVLSVDPRIDLRHRRSGR